MILNYEWWGRDSSREIKDVFITFAALLYAAGFESLGGHGTQYVETFGRFRPPVLKIRFLNNRSAAKNILVKAINESTKNVQEFRRAILSCKDPTLRLHLNKDGFDTTRGNADDKKIAKNHLRESNTFISSMYRCQNCTTLSETKMSSCPCKIATYCSKECQIVHWDIHKKVCKHRLLKQKESA